MIGPIVLKRQILFLTFTAVLCLASCKTTDSGVQNEVKAKEFSTQLELPTPEWSDIIKVQCQNCRKREEEGQ